jgi:hypothetical protein
MVMLVLFLTVINERLVEWFINPLFKRFGWDTFFLTYVALVTGVALSLAVGANVFMPEFIPVWVGVGLTAVFVGGGSNLLHQIVPQKSPLLGMATGLSEVGKGEGAS